MVAIPLAASQATLSAGELPFGNLAFLLKGTPKDVPCPQSCDQCRKEFCIERVPVRECVTGKKRVYDCKVRYQCVVIPETRYRWKTMCVTEEIPCCYCKPVCKTRDVNHCYESEQWEEQEFGTCAGCGGIYCKYCENKVEKVPCKHCEREPGKTTIKVCYRSCMKESYIVYRQVKRPVCVKQPRYERVKVPITKYVCRNCDGGGCEQCCDDPAGCQIYSN
jgi:hypothetical protein